MGYRRPLAFRKKENSELKVGSKTLLGSLPHLRASFRGKDLAQKYAGDKPPLRSELFSRAKWNSMARFWRPPQVESDMPRTGF
jgi:hypothetical protein